MTRVQRILPVAVGALAAYELALGLWMVVAPRSFYDQVAAFGGYPPHFIRDVATWQVALGVTLAAAVGRAARRPPRRAPPRAGPRRCARSRRCSPGCTRSTTGSTSTTRRRWASACSTRSP